jgi:CRISPR system Cascade subunit CasB
MSTAGQFVKKKIEEISARAESPRGRAEMAKLRHGIGKSPADSPGVWDITLAGDEDAASNGPSFFEWAVHIALTLYSIHRKHRDGSSLGQALRALAVKRDNEDMAKRRLDMLATSEGLAELERHLRSAVQLLAAEDVPLDFAMLADDVYSFQFPDGRDRARLDWGRDFYHYTNKENKGESDEQ